MTEHSQIQGERASALWHDLRQFITQTKLRLVREGEPMSGVKIGDKRLTFGTLDEELVELVTVFCQEAAKYVESQEVPLRWGATGPSFSGIGLERLLISNWLWQSIMWHRSIRPLPADEFESDVTGILSFFSQTSQRRYEQLSPQFTVEYVPCEVALNDYGRLGKPLLDEYRALLRLCRDSHTLLRVKQGLTIVGLQAGLRSESEDPRTPVPPQLLHLQKRTAADPSSIVFNLNPDGSQEIFQNGAAVFRMSNGTWRHLMNEEALNRIKRALVKHDEYVARNILLLALDLAHRGEGALLVLCEEPTDEVFRRILYNTDGLIKSHGMRHPELPPRKRFTQLVGDTKITLGGQPYSQITRLLCDVSSIDGATIFSGSGRLLGFGCLVSPLLSDGIPSPLAEGARTTAAKMVSAYGVAIKVSSDHTATLFCDGEEWGVIW